MLGRRSIISRKVALSVVLDGASLFDPAIDLEKSDIKAYQESLYDMKHIVCKPGEKLTLFKIQPLTRRQKDAAIDLSTRDAANFKVRCGLLEIENYSIQKDDGSIIIAENPIRKDSGRFGQMATEEYIDSLNLTTDQLIALSIMITTISEAQLPLSKPSAPVVGQAELSA